MRGQGEREESLENIEHVCAHFAHTSTECVSGYYVSDEYG